MQLQQVIAHAETEELFLRGVRLAQISRLHEAIEVFSSVLDRQDDHRKALRARVSWLSTAFSDICQAAAMSRIVWPATYFASSASR